MTRLRVLITNIAFASRSGTEMYVHDLALWLLRSGHRPLIYSPYVGPLADAMRRASVPVVDDIGKITEPPDIVHGHHSLETMTALLQFPDVPAIFVCHDFDAWHDHAPTFPRLRRYVAVDEACRDRLTLVDGIAAEQVAFLQNGVDLRKFRFRGRLPEHPSKALLLSNYADAEHNRTLQKACAARGIQLDHAGARLGGVTDQPEELLQDYHLVFAKGRCAWEALATGAAVIVCDALGVGPLVTSGQLEHLRKLNFGRRLLVNRLDPKIIDREISRYDAEDVERVSRRVRRISNLDVLGSQLVDLYQAVIQEQRDHPVDRAGELQATAQVMHWWSRNHTERTRQAIRRRRLWSVIRRSSATGWRRVAGYFRGLRAA